jgi:hypothetical protein
MDDLISHCVEEIALDGEQGNHSLTPFLELFHPSFLPSTTFSPRVLTLVSSGTTLQRLWSFAHDFQLAQASSEEIPAELDHDLKKRIWKHLVKREEIMLKADNQVLQSADGTQDLESLLERYNDSLNLFASEDKQWLSITGLPKNALPVLPPLCRCVANDFRFPICSSNCCRVFHKLVLPE